MASDSRIVEGVRIDVRLKISALWVAMLFLFAYGDIFGLFARGRIDEIEVARSPGSRSRRRSCSRRRSMSRSRA